MRNALHPERTYAITDLACNHWDAITTSLILAGHHDAGPLPLDHPLLRRQPDLVAKAEAINERAKRATYEALNPEARS